MSENALAKRKISVIIPIFNGSKWIDDCFHSIIQQERCPDFKIEVCVHDDCSSDSTPLQLIEWEKKFSLYDIESRLSRGSGSKPRGVGFSKNRAVDNSNGEYLCFQDIDDVMHPTRLLAQLTAAMSNHNAIVGSQFIREPRNSTKRFTNWANSLSQTDLKRQIYTSHGPTIIMPTWFCSRQVFDRVGGFSEEGAGTPEDLLFFYRHLDLGGDVIRVDQVLLTYRFHPEATTNSISEHTIWDIRLKRLEEKVLSNWTSFTIWNAGKQGRRLWRSLSADSKLKVQCFCDIDRKKIGNVYVPYTKGKSENIEVPIRHFRDCLPPFVICVKLDLTDGDFEKNLMSLNLLEGADYVLFS